MMRPLRKLAIVGASARAAAFSALAAEYEIVAADMFGDADLARACPTTRIARYPDDLADWLATCDCDAWMYTGALENHPELIDRMAALRPLLGNSGDALRRVRDPLAIQIAFSGVDIAFPETRPSADELPRDGSWLCKTYRGASGSGVWRLDSDAALDRAVREDAVFQRFISGLPCAAILAASAGGARVLGVTRQLLGPDADKPWRYAGSIGPVRLGDESRRQVELISETLATHFGLRGLVGVDLVATDERVWVIEVNPRYTASVEVLERAATTSSIAAHVEACTSGASCRAADGGRGWPTDVAAEVHGKKILFAARDIKIPLSFFEWSMELTAPNGRPILADLPHANEVIAAGRPMLSVFASGRTAEDCLRLLDERAAMVESRAEG